MFYELINYDLEGPAWKNGSIVDAPFLVVEAKRRAGDLGGGQEPTPESDDAPDGQPIRLRVDLDKADPTKKATLISLYQQTETLIRELAAEEIARMSVLPEALEAKISEATEAERARAEAAKATALEQAKLVELQRLVAEAEAKLAAAPTQGKP